MALWRLGDVILSFLIFFLVAWSVGGVLYPLKEDGHLGEVAFVTIIQLSSVGAACAYIVWTVTMVSTG